MALTTATAHADGTPEWNNQVFSDLRLDTTATAGDYSVYLYDNGNGVPTLENDVINGWFGVNLANSPGTYGDEFTQIGVVNDPAGLHWFFYSELGYVSQVVCLRGRQYYTDPQGRVFGCISDTQDLGVGVTTWTKVELSYYASPPPSVGGYWEAYVYDQNGVQTPVAAVANVAPGEQIFRAYVSSEEAAFWSLTQQVDPWLYLDFWYYHPRYGFGSNALEWPASDGPNVNQLNVQSNTQYPLPPEIPCPYHYWGVREAADPRQWGATSTNTLPQFTQCNFIPLF
jgi:hypothetical protein